MFKRLQLESKYKERWEYILINPYGYHSTLGHPWIVQRFCLKMLKPGAVSRLEASNSIYISCQECYNMDTLWLRVK